ncbi:hypothetical protein J5839_03865 [Methanosarcinaceae archaeon]|nr:hypothetical protein [Methanosarcinaceae archaeon]
MQIEDRFDSVEKILETAESEGFTFRIGYEAADDTFDCDAFDDDPFNDDSFDHDLSYAGFSAEMPEDEIESLERSIEGASAAEEKEEQVAAPEDVCGKYDLSPEILKADIVYVDLFLKKSYKHTLIIERSADSETGKNVYEIVAVCETTMCRRFLILYIFLFIFRPSSVCSFFLSAGQSFFSVVRLFCPSSFFCRPSGAVRFIFRGQDPE